MTSLGKKSNVGDKNNTENEALEETEAEDDQMNAGWSVLLKYFEACGGYFVMFTIFFVVFLFALGTIDILRTHFWGMGVQKLQFLLAFSTLFMLTYIG